MSSPHLRSSRAARPRVLLLSCVAAVLLLPLLVTNATAGADTPPAHPTNPTPDDVLDPATLGLPTFEALDTSPAPLRNTPAVLDVGIYYDAASIAHWGNENALRNAIVASVDSANVFLDRSGLAQPVTFNLMVLKKVDYQGSGNDQIELTRLTVTNDGRLDFIHTERNNNALDLVTLITPITGCGIAFALGNRGGSPHLGFSVVDPNCLGEGTVTYAHEVGHNLGAAHDPGNASNGNFFPNGFGYVDRAIGVVTIMAYLPPDRCCNYVGRFSNPNVTFQGRPMGTANAHNAKVINDNALVVSRYRTGPPTTPRNLSTAAGDAKTTVTWMPPTTDRGYAVTSYRVTASPGGRSCSTGAGQRSCTVTGLNNGTRYTFSVTAANPQGTSTAATTQATPVGGQNSGPTGDAQFVTTPGSNEGFALVANTKQWVGTSCRSQLQNAGATFTSVAYSTIANTPGTSNNRTCNELQGLIGSGSGGGNGSFAYRAVNGNPAGWVLVGNTKQWINASCRQQLQSAGATFTTVPYNNIGSIPNTSNTLPCEQLGSGGGNGSFSYRAVTGNPAGWVLIGNTKQWINASCRQQLQNAGATFTTVPYNSIGNIPNATNTLPCAQLS